VIVLVAQYEVKAGQGEAVARALRKMTPLVREHEPGCVLYQANRSRENPDQFLLYEVYSDEEALETHRSTPHFREIVENTILPLLVSRHRVFYDPVTE
jgi:autoinducer 2-degrading protein